MGTRTIDEGSLDEKSGMNFSEYVAILSGNTDLLEKAKLEKKVAALESERQAFNKNKASSVYKFEGITRTVDGNKEKISRMTSDWADFQSRVKQSSAGEILNPVQLKDVQSADPKAIAAKLHELSEKSNTNE